jgi:hypothetical protein
MNSPLSVLTSMICSGDFVSLERVSQRLSEKYKYRLSTEEDVERFLYDHELIEGIKLLVGSRSALVRMAQEVDSSFSDDGTEDRAIRSLLRALHLPSPPDLSQPLGAACIWERLEAMRRDLKHLARSGRVREHHLRSYTLDGWTYIEHLLKSTIGYYALLFTDFDELVTKRFQKARKQHSLRPLLKAMRAIEDEFLDPTKQQQFTIDEQPKREAQKSQYEASRGDLKKQALRSLGRESPFAGFPFDKYDNDSVVNLFRNAYAHDVKEVLGDLGVKPLIESLEVTVSLVDDLISPDIAPSVIFITAKGGDEYGRGLLWFVEEQYAGQKTEDRREHELRMFQRNADKVELLRPYLVTSPTKDRMFEPFMVQLSEIEGIKLHESL